MEVVVGRAGKLMLDGCTVGHYGGVSVLGRLAGDLSDVVEDVEFYAVDCTFASCQTGVKVYGSGAQAALVRCIIENCITGLHVQRAAATLRASAVRGCGTGVYCTDRGLVRVGEGLASTQNSRAGAEDYEVIYAVDFVSMNEGRIDGINLVDHPMPL